MFIYPQIIITRQTEFTLMKFTTIFKRNINHRGVIRKLTGFKVEIASLILRRQLFAPSQQASTGLK